MRARFVGWAAGPSFGGASAMSQQAVAVRAVFDAQSRREAGKGLLWSSKNRWLAASCAAGMRRRPRCGERGVCGAQGELVVARAALHMWEEPPISGSRGSGTVFFSNCPLRCVYCQNQVIADGRAGVPVTVDEVADMCLDLQQQGALNVNFVTPTHYSPHIRAAVAHARARGLALPWCGTPRGTRRCGPCGTTSARWTCT